MKTASYSLFCIMTLSCFNAFAQQCSGGAEGGMDATGNLCNAPSQHGGPTSGKTDLVEGSTADLVKPVVIAPRIMPNEKLRGPGGVVLIRALPDRGAPNGIGRAPYTDFKARDLSN